MNRSKNNSAILAAVASAHSKEPTVNVLSFDLAGQGMARVVCSVNHSGNSREDHASVLKALKARFGGKMEAVAGSFTSLDNGEYQQQISGIVSVVREAMPYSAKNVEGFKAVAANMFLDEEEHMWVVRKSAAGDLVVKTTGIDDDLSLVKVLNEACSSAQQSLSSVSDFRRMVAHASAISDRVQGGDFVSYVNLDNVIATGFVVATVLDEANPEVKKAVILPVGSEAEEVINTKAITEVHAQDDFPEHEESEAERIDTAVASARGEVNLQVLLDYYKRVFARSPQFYNEFAKRLKQHAFA